MRQFRSRLADALLAHAVRVMPPGRADWAEGMLAEAEHLATNQRLAFAIGCVRGSYRLRLTDAATLVTMGRWLIILGLCSGAAILFRTASVLRFGDASALIFVQAVVCLTAAGAFVRWGLDRLPMIAACSFSAGFIAMLVVGDPNALFSGASPSSSFYRAILLEQAVAWMALFGLAHALIALETSRSHVDSSKA